MVEESILVRKLNYKGEETWRWTGKLVERRDPVIVVDAIFNGKPRDLGYMKLETTDLFHEFYYSDRWFNIFQVFSADGTLKGWYCNITKPAQFIDGQIDFVDMVLDVFVYPNGRPLVLDEDEFAQNRETEYLPEDAQKAGEAVDELLRMAEREEYPFGTGGPGSREEREAREGDGGGADGVTRGETIR